MMLNTLREKLLPKILCSFFSHFFIFTENKKNMRIRWRFSFGCSFWSHFESWKCYANFMWWYYISAFPHVNQHLSLSLFLCFSLCVCVIVISLFFYSSFVVQYRLQRRPSFRPWLSLQNIHVRYLRTSGSKRSKKWEKRKGMTLKNTKKKDEKKS